MSPVEIRHETACDVDGIREVNVEAFRNHPVSRQTEHLIVEALRAAGALGLSLVAISEGTVVGHIAFSKASIGESEADWFLLGPLAVLPELQGQGIGSMLVESGLRQLRSMSANGCALVGDPDYYERFGFNTFAGLNYEGVPAEYVLALPLTGTVPTGTISAHRAFEVGL